MRAKPTNDERFFKPHEIIVSKTDLEGIITYANRTFIEVAGYSESELLGRPHNIIRHPDMPKCVFEMLWETIQSGQEIFAYVKNMSKDGAFYWVHAHVTPTFDAAGQIAGYHSNRRVPNRAAVTRMEALYRKLKQIEDGQRDSRRGMALAREELGRVLQAAGVAYEEFIFLLED